MKILDACYGSKMFWYDKHEPHTTYIDNRSEKSEVKIMDKNKLIDFSGPSKDPKVNYEINSIKSEQCFMCKNIQDQLDKELRTFDSYLE